MILMKMPIKKTLLKLLKMTILNISIKRKTDDSTLSEKTVQVVFDEDEVGSKKVTEQSFNFDFIKTELMQQSQNANKSIGEKYLKFRAKINPTDNSSAEKEL